MLRAGGVNDETEARDGVGEFEAQSEGLNDPGGDEQARATAETVARRSYGKLVAFLSARTHDVAAAEDALSEAFASALADWPVNGCPANPEGWLMTVARRKIIDSFRGQRRGEVASEHLQGMAEGFQAAAESAEIPAAKAPSPGSRAAERCRR